jgi:hypothetical protein
VVHLMSRLIETNLTWLRQASALLAQIDDRSYADSPRGMAPHRVGGHLRHILEFYQCFLDGLESAEIDYDARRRDELVERSRPAAALRIREIIRRFETMPEVQWDFAVQAKIEDADEPLSAPLMFSSVSRELQVLSSHTIHHFALIAMTLRLHGVQVDPDFGMAPSTLRYQQLRKAA